jgi:predicted DNA-binding transcriptional regulator
VDGLNNLAANLSLTLSDVENQMPKYVERFKKEIRQSLEKFEKESEEMKDILGD